MSSQIKVLSNVDRVRTTTLTTIDTTFHEDLDPLQLTNPPNTMMSNQFCVDPPGRLKHESEAKSFKLIDEKEWNIATSEPSSEANFFCEGHSAMSIISVIGTTGVGKSTLLNKIARKEAFKTHKPSDKLNVTKHLSKGIVIHSTHHRMLLDCQPLLATSVLDDFISGSSSSQFPKNSPISDPLTSCHMISLQLATFLIATSDYVIIMTKWFIDIHLLKLIASAIMMIGEDNLRAKFIVYSEDKSVHDPKLKIIIESGLGRDRIERYFDNESELLDYISPYSSEKCELYHKDPSTFTGKNWLSSCQRLWDSTIKNSSMFSDYAIQLYNSNQFNIV